MFDVQEEIELAQDFLAQHAPARVKRLKALANLSLREGPFHYDPETMGECCAEDDGAIAFSFESAVQELSDWADETISDVSVSSFEENEDGEEIEVVHSIDGSANALRAGFFGELAPYL